MKSDTLKKDKIKKKWFASLKRSLGKIPEEERGNIMDYYEEIFADSEEKGKTSEEIISELGSPAHAAEKILAEEEKNGILLKSGKKTKLNPAVGDGGKKEIASEEKYFPEPGESKPAADAAKSKKRKTGVAPAIGLAFFWILIGIPVSIAALTILLSVGVSLAAIAVSGAGCTIGGVAAFALSIAEIFYGSGASAILADVGLSIGSAGIGLLLFGAFGYLTFVYIKYSARFLRFAFGKIFGGKGR